MKNKTIALIATLVMLAAGVFAVAADGEAQDIITDADTVCLLQPSGGYICTTGIFLPDSLVNVNREITHIYKVGIPGCAAPGNSSTQCVQWYGCRFELPTPTYSIPNPWDWYCAKLDFLIDSGSTDAPNPQPQQPTSIPAVPQQPSFTG